jgi:hypothetical protein
MSIAVLNQVYDEARRLAVAGSVVARGDFRLKKLLPPLDQAGAKAPVFAKVSEAAKKVIEGPEASSAENLLELTSLVTAVLYTQGETGQPGDLKPIDPINLGGELAQTSARLLKPLLEALTSTGSGRLERIKDAHERGAFRDLRLIRPALGGLDDSYAEIGDFLAAKVLPMYGKAILPELRAKYDPKGTKGHPRRLKLMHAIDPAATRDLVKQGLEDGSKDVKVAAIECLGDSPDDLAYLAEQAGAKAQDVRRAAYVALARIDDPAAVAVFEKALAGRDLELAATAISVCLGAQSVEWMTDWLEDDRDPRRGAALLDDMQTRFGRPTGNERLTRLLLTEIEKDWGAIQKLKDKKAVGQLAFRLSQLIDALPAQHADADALTLRLFDRRAEMAGVKGTDFGGADVIESVVGRMTDGSDALVAVLAEHHAELDSDTLVDVVAAARDVLPPDRVYDLFAPYLEAGAGKKGLAGEKRDAVIRALTTGSYFGRRRSQPGRERPLDPRWLDLAVRLKHLELVRHCGRPGQPAAEAFLSTEFDDKFKKAKNQDAVEEVVSAMVALRHPRAADALLASYEKTIGKANAWTYWYYHLIPDLPKSALPRLEALVPRLKGTEADNLLEAIQELRDKKD